MKLRQLSFFASEEKKTEIDAPEIIVYVDGASRGNPGKAGIGVVITEPSSLQESMGFFVGIKTNNQAEYLALLYALWFLHEYNGCQGPIRIHADSELMVKQVNGVYRVKNDRLKPLFLATSLFLKRCPCVITHVKRDKNLRADAMANRGIDLRALPPKKFQDFLQDYGIAF